MNSTAHFAMSEHTLINLYGPSWTTNHRWWVHVLRRIIGIYAREHVCTHAQLVTVLTNACAQTSRNSKARCTATCALEIL